jgi:hypothetical protein
MANPTARPAGKAKRRAEHTRRAASLRISDFLALVAEGVEGRMGRRMRGFESRRRFGYLQYFRGASAVHYEIWVQRKTARLEIGLHFEGERDANYAAAALLADRAADVVDAIGPEYELEEWTPQWTQLHRSFAAPSLTPELADEAAGHAAALIDGMEPLIARLGLR